MKLSLRGEYALRALVVLGETYHQGVVSVPTIATRQKIPQNFLVQILHDLKGGGFVESRRGVAGGYRLARSPELVYLVSVIRHIEGALAPVSCVSERFYQPCTCPDESTCAIRSLMKEVREAILKTLEHVTVADLCSRAHRLKAQLANLADYAI
jgi:Rrf2 family transcriptional regulator, cysteine metabolism repressor